MSRERLPSRRDGRTGRMTWRAPNGAMHEFIVTVGFYPPDASGKRRAGEVFANGPKTGTDLRALIEDGCVLASNLLQMGRTLPDLMNRLGHVMVEDPEKEEPVAAATSAIGAILRFANQLECETLDEASP